MTAPDGPDPDDVEDADTPHRTLRDLKGQHATLIGLHTMTNLEPDEDYL